MESHIIPKFFGREFKKRTHSQTLVNGINPEKNPQPQDITKVYLLCQSCEKLFSKWETEFRNKIMPANKSLLAPITYGDWMLKFAVSVSWRILAYLKYSQPYSEKDVTSKELINFFLPLSQDSHVEAEKALETWGLFLLDKRTDVAPYDQHFLLLSGKNFPNENCNALAFTIFQDDGIVATHALMAQFVILGFIKQSPEWEWKGTEIDPISGQIGLQQTIPQVYATWLAKMFEGLENVSVNDWKRRNKVRT
jgi:hypothetical protein